MTSTFVLSALVGFILTVATQPLMSRLAFATGLLDRPDGKRKLHRRVVPLGGGVVVLAGTLGAICLALMIHAPWSFHLFEFRWDVLGLLSAALLICLIGLWDDRFEMRGRQKLLGQILACLIVVASGFVVQQVTIFNLRLDLGITAIPLTVIWLLAAINSFNLIDGIDGLATSLGICISGALALMAMLSGHLGDALIAACLTGALCGFLVFNYPPARMFLGDTGSMLIGLLLGTLAVRCSMKGPATVAFIVPAVVWTVPMFDTSMAILRRKLTGNSIYATDRGHIHHVLQHRGFSGRRVLLTVSLLAACTATGSILAVTQNNELYAIATAAGVLATLIGFRLFGHREVKLLTNRTISFANSFTMRPPTGDQERQTNLRTHIQGTRDWEELWGSVVEYGKRFEMSRICLNVHLPHVHEAFHAEWSRYTKIGKESRWQAEIPFFHDDKKWGFLRLEGVTPPGASAMYVGEIIAGLKGFERQTIDLLESLEQSESEPIKEFQDYEPVGGSQLGPLEQARPIVSA